MKPIAQSSLGLGELTFLQLSTTYAPPSVAGHGLGYGALALFLSSI